MAAPNLTSGDERYKKNWKSEGKLSNLTINLDPAKIKKMPKENAANEKPKENPKIGSRASESQNLNLEENKENHSRLAADSQNSRKANNCEQQKVSAKKEVPQGFYVAHPKIVKGAPVCPQDLQSRKLAELLEAFHMFDFDRDGIINEEDLKKTFASLNRKIDDDEIQQMLSEGPQPLNFDAFVILLGYKTLDLDPEEVFLDALSNWDDHHEGLISYDRILHDVMASGEKFTEEEANSALADAPIVLTKNKEKLIDYFQFSEDLCGLRKIMHRKQPSQSSVEIEAPGTRNRNLKTIELHNVGL